jgi:glutamate/tyrosine decarboxylase-like PLP-dependent enzyme
VLVKDRAAMLRAHRYSASYMQDAVAGQPSESLSPADLSPELSRHFRGLRLWLPLKLHGIAPFRACLEEKLLLARYFHGAARAMGFEVGPEPELSVAVYRWTRAAADADAFNQALAREVHRDGRVFLSSTMLGGRFTLRLAALAFRTHLEAIDMALRVLREAVERLGGGPPHSAARP